MHNTITATRRSLASCRPLHEGRGTDVLPSLSSALRDFAAGLADIFGGPIEVTGSIEKEGIDNQKFIRLSAKSNEAGISLQDHLTQVSRVIAGRFEVPETRLRFKCSLHHPSDPNTDEAEDLGSRWISRLFFWSIEVPDVDGARIARFMFMLNPNL